MTAARRIYGFSALLALAAVGCRSDGASKPAPAAEKVCTFPQGVPGVDAVCGCTRVEGDLALDAGERGDLRCLRTLREVTGKLSIAARMSSPVLASLRGLGQLRSVGALALSGLGVTDLTAFAQLRSAAEVSLSGLPRIQDLRGLERVTWARLTLQNNPELRSLDGLHVPERATSITLRGNPKLESLELLRGLRAAESVLLGQLSALASLEGLAGEIDRLDIAGCDQLADLRGLRADIRALRLENNANLRSLDGFVGLSRRPGAASGPDVRIENHPKLESLDGLFRSDHPAIDRLQLLGLPKIEAIDLRAASALNALVVRTCAELREIRGVAELETLQQLHLTGLPALPRLPAFDKLRSVGDFELIELALIADLEPLASLTSGDAMSLNMLDSLTSLHGFEQLSRARRLLLEDLPALANLDGLRGLQSAETLWIADSDKLKNLRGLSLTKATELAVRYNDKLQTLDGLEMLSEIGTLDFSENPELVSVRALHSLRQPARIFARANRQLPQCELDRLAMRLPSGSTHEFADNGPAGSCAP